MDNWHMLFGGLLVLAGAMAFAQKYAGADAALKEIGSPLPAKPTQPEYPDPFATYAKDINRFRRETSKGSPVENATGWLALVDHCPPSDASETNSTELSLNLAFSDAMSALPSPAAWPEMERILRERLTRNKGKTKGQVLLAMVEALRGERDQASGSLSNIKGLPANMATAVAKIEVDLALLDQRPDKIESAYHFLIAALNSEPRSQGAEQAIELPDLTGLIGQARARDLLVYALLKFDGEVVVKRADPFARVARHLALAMVGRLKHPQWALADDQDGGPLFGALRRRFPSAKTGTPVYPGAGNSYYTAALRYVAYLVASDRPADAVAFLKDLQPYQQSSWGSFDYELPFLRGRHKLETFIRFLEREVAAGDPGQILDLYESFCQDIGQTQREEAFVAKLPASKRGGFYSQEDRQFDDLIANGKLEAAGTLLVKHLSSSARNQNNNASTKLIEIGRATKRADWVELGTNAAIDAYRNASFGSPEDSILLDLAEHGRAAEAERILADVLQKRTHDGSTSIPPNGQMELLTLMRVYGVAGRWSDVLTVLKRAPNLGENDVAFLERSDPDTDSISYLTARALVSEGRRPEALHVLSFVLDTEPDNDGAYALLLKIDPSGASSLLEAMHLEAPLEPRPLIWKAEWLRRNHKLAAAEQMVRRAIDLDPEDSLAVGFPRSKRFLARQVLADIERDEGKSREAAADRRLYTDQAPWSARSILDLNGPSIRAKALVDNPGDYIGCLQVADDLDRKGKTKEATAMMVQAAKQAALELGPASSEDWPSYRQSRYSLFQRILSDEVAKHPARASTFAALGAVCGDLDESAMAKGAYLRAVTLDSNYLVAWSGLMELQNSLTFPVDFQESLVTNLARLDPKDLAREKWDVRDLAKVWTAANAALRYLPSVEEPIFRLGASSLSSLSDPINNEGTRSQARPPTAGSIVAADRTIADFALLVGALSASSEGKAN